MLMEMLSISLSFAFTIMMLWFCWESTVMISEKKERQRKGLTDYYDNPITKNKCMGGEDE